MITISFPAAALSAVIGLISLGLNLYQRHNNLIEKAIWKARAEVWLYNAKETALACTALKEDCYAGKATVQEAGGRIGTISSGAAGLYSSILDALNRKEGDPKP